MTHIPSISDYGISARGYAEFFDGIPAAIFRTTLEGKIVYCNKAFANIFGFDSAAELIDSPVIELYRNKKDRGVFIHSILQRGRLFDLPIALGILAGSGQLESDRFDGFAVVGELSLEGRTRPVKGALSMAMAAARQPGRGA